MTLRPIRISRLRFAAVLAGCAVSRPRPQGVE